MYSIPKSTSGRQILIWKAVVSRTNPEVHADLSYMRYDVNRNKWGQAIKAQGWIYTPRRTRTKKVASDMPADKDATQTVQILDLSSRLDNYVMHRNKSKEDRKRQTKTIPAGPCDGAIH